MTMNLIDGIFPAEYKDTTNTDSREEYYERLHEALYEACIEDPHVAAILNQVLDEHSTYLESQTL